VVAVNGFLGEREVNRNVPAQGGNDDFHHYAAILKRIILRPVDRFYIIIKVIIIFRQVGKISIGKTSMSAVHPLMGLDPSSVYTFFIL